MSIETLFSSVNTVIGSGVLILFIGSIGLSASGLRLPRWMIHCLLVVICLGIFLLPQMYERVFGLPPCYLCWLQRICMWPVALLLPVALYRRQIALLAPYLTILLSIATVIGLYHYSLQFGVAPITITCGAVGQSVSCGGIEVLVFEFLTIPLMAVLSNVSLILLLQKNAK